MNLSLCLQTASDVSCLLALLQVRDARWAFTLMRLSPQLARSGNPSSSLSQARLAVGLAMLGMPVVADKVSLFPLLSTRTEWPTVSFSLPLYRFCGLFSFPFYAPFFIRLALPALSCSRYQSMGLPPYCGVCIPQMEGPLALLQAAALFDLTTKPRSLTPEMIIPAAKALYHRVGRPLPPLSCSGSSRSIIRRVEDCTLLVDLCWTPIPIVHFLLTHS